MKYVEELLGVCDIMIVAWIELFIYSSSWNRNSLCNCSYSRSADQMCRQDSRVHLSAEEEIAAEESLSIYCKPVELYNILQRRAIRNVMCFSGQNLLLLFWCRWFGRFPQQMWSSWLVLGTYLVHISVKSHIGFGGGNECLHNLC